MGRHPYLPLLVGVLFLTDPAAPRAQDKDGKAAEAAAKAVQALRKACGGAEEGLRGVFIEKGEEADGQLKLAGLIDNEGQRTRVREQTEKLLKDAGDAAKFPKGVSDVGLKVFPVRSTYRALLQEHFASDKAESAHARGLLRGTRVDDLHYDADSAAVPRLVLVGAYAYLGAPTTPLLLTGFPSPLPAP